MRRTQRVLVGVGVLAGLLVAAAVTVYFFRPPPPEGPPEGPGVPPEEKQLAAGKQLYANHCAACHGDQGDGNGAAAHFLYPRPRNFGERKFRLASTTNGIPTDDDLVRVITRGMPGSAMFAFGHLPEEDRKALAAHVRRLMHTLVEGQIRQELADADPEEVERLLDEMLQPGDAVEVPPGLPESSPESIARGRELYVKAACVSCHGQTGKGDGVQDQRNDDGMPTRPRDFTQGIFKGGREPAQLYARIMSGMFGTPMQSARGVLEPQQAGDVINYVLSLSDPSVAAEVEHKRQQITAKRVDNLPGDGGEAAWGQAPAVPVVVSPLWWRDHVPPGLRVQAVHDGTTLAVRLTWKDDTRNAEPVRPQDFEDMAALQLFQGKTEPFLGMGSADSPVDVWHWRPRRATPSGASPDVDTTYPNMAVDWYPFEKLGEGPRAHGPQRQPRDFIAAWAAGNPLTDPDNQASAANLRAGGFGTLTMMPRISQAVAAQGAWQAGRWSVVLSRPLKVEKEAGVPLAPGDKASIAFAVWDGAFRDRNGQKLASVWHDLELE